MKLKLLSLCMIVGLYGCASRVGSVADQNIPDERLSLIATAGASQAKTGHAIINSIDGQPVIGWKYKVAPGVHSVEISSQQMSLKRTIYVRTEAGKRYDISFDGIAYVRDRKTADDQQYLGPDPSKPFTMLFAGSNGVFVEKDEYDRSVAKQDLNFPEMEKNLENYTYNGTALKVNSVLRDHKYGWFSCEN